MGRLGIGVVALWLIGMPVVASEPFVVSKVTDGLYRGPPPRDRCHFEQLRQLGIRTVLDLRSWVPGSSRREADLGAEYGISCQLYRWPATPWKKGGVESAYPYLLRQDLRPLYIHCHTSRERTGLVIGLYRVREQGWAPLDAYCEMLRNGLRGFFWYYHDYFWKNTYGPGQPAWGRCCPDM